MFIKHLNVVIIYVRYWIHNMAPDIICREVSPNPEFGILCSILVAPA